MKGVVVFSDIYACAVSFCWRRGCVTIRGLCYEHDGISIDEVIKDISTYSGVPEDEIKRLLRKMQRREGYYQTTLRELEAFARRIARETRAREAVARLALVSIH